MFELGKTIDQYNEMTWAEYTLCREGWIRENVRRWEHTRHISYYIYSSIPEKGKKKSMTSFMPLPGDYDTYVVNDETKDTLRQMQLEYHNKVNNK